MDVYRKKYVVLDLENLDSVLETTIDGFDDPSVDEQQGHWGDTDHYFPGTFDPDQNNPHMGKISSSNSIVTTKGWGVSLFDSNETFFPSESQDSDAQRG